MLLVLGLAGTLAPAAAQAGSLAAARTAALSTRLLAGQTPTAVVHGAVLRGHHDPHDLLTLDIGLGVHNSAALDAFIAAVSTPGNPQYGHYLTRAQYLARFAPTGQEVQAVRDWADGAGLSVQSVSPNNLLVVVRGTTTQVEHTLGVTLNDYRTPDRVFRSNDRDPTVPASLDIQAISGLSTFDQVHTTLGRAMDVRPGGYYPGDFRSAYNVTPVGDGSGQTIGLTLWGAPVAQSDLDTFANQTSSPDLVAGQPGPDGIDWIAVNGGSTDLNEQDETAMDVEYAHGIAPHSHLKYWLSDCTPNGNTCTPDLVGLEQDISAAANDTSLHVVSNSWGMGQEAPSTTDPFVLNTAASFQYADSVGTTFYFASGDQGSFSGSGGGSTPLPSYPADSPYVVAVGGTSLYTNQDFSYSSESAWSGSGGGCSMVFTRPAWQNGVAPAATCAGRAEPDIAADGDPTTGAYVYYQGSGAQIGGTSLATPLWAGMAAVLDNNLGAGGQPLMGFSAPRFYQLATTATTYARDFHDVTSGNNGYPAGQGWDEATGWGTPNLANLAADWPTSSAPGPTNTSTPLPTGTTTPCGAACSGSWSSQSSGTSVILHGVSCPNTTTCYAVGEAGTLVATSNGGSTWTAQNTPLSGSLFILWGIACPTTSTCFAVGDNGTILATTNGGGTWTSQNNPASGTLNSLRDITCLNASTCYAVGDSGLILATTDGGAAWTIQNNALSNSYQTLWSISCSSATTCAGVYDAPTVLATTDGGATWNSQNTGTTDSLSGIACPATGTCYAVGGVLGTAAIVATTDGGNTWNSQLGMTQSQLLNRLSCPDATTCYAVGAAGTILSTTDGGNTWNSENSNSAANLYDVSCPTTGTCYSVGQGGNILVRRPTSAVTPTSTATPQPTSTATPRPVRTATPVPTSTTLPPATNTPLPPAATNTPLPPTPTNTPLPPAPTNTPLPPVATNTPLPPAATNTPLPPVATNTPLPPAPTNTAVPPAPTNTAVPPTATRAPLLPATNTPVVEPATDTPVSSGSAQATATPLSAAPTATDVPVQRGGGKHRSTLPLTVSAPHSIAAGRTLVVNVRTAPHAQVVVSAQVVGTVALVMGKGAHRHRSLHTITLYKATLRGTADARGHLTLGLRITYQPARPLQARLIVTAQHGRATATHTLFVTIQPQPHSRHQSHHH